MINVSRIKRGIVRNFPPIAIILTLIVLSGGVVINYSHAQQRAKDKAAVLADLRTSQAKAATDATDTRLKTHSDVSNVVFKDVSDEKFQKPTCSRLENRSTIVITNSGCSYYLRAKGQAKMAVVLVYEGGYSKPDYDQLTSKDASNVNSLAYINTYLQMQARRYKVADPASIDLSFFGPYPVAESVVNTYYRDNGGKLIDIYQKTLIKNKVPEQDYDMVHYVLLNPSYGGIAFPGMHRAFTYNSSTVPTFTHETLHLFGATDKYNNNDCNTIGTNDPFGRYQGSLPGVDIMCSNFNLATSMINDITAREIGWAN